jgi:phosphoribosylformimino-5-aminoimidazole carboxamide ribotide isomerase
LARAIRIPVIASGGISCIEDVRALGELVADGVIGAITGRAIYEGTLNFAEGRRLAEQF